jgi:hypothetical protein
MFSSVRFKNIYPVNKKISDYCMTLTNNSIRKITEKYNTPVVSNENPSLPNNNHLIIKLLFFLSTSSFLYYFINLQNINMFSFIRYIDVSRK